MNPYLYLLVRNDLHSMNPGKMVAQAAHSANQFTFETDAYLEHSINMDRPSEPSDVVIQYNYNHWLANVTGFGTTITLAVSLLELQTAVMVAQSLPELRSGQTIDPTYPYILEPEYAALIDHDSKVSSTTLEDMPDGRNIPTRMADGRMLCLREEITTAYVFGDKMIAQMVVGKFPLLP